MRGRPTRLPRPPVGRNGWSTARVAALPGPVMRRGAPAVGGRLAGAERRHQPAVAAPEGPPLAPVGAGDVHPLAPDGQGQAAPGMATVRSGPPVGPRRVSVWSWRASAASPSGATARRVGTTSRGRALSPPGWSGAGRATGRARARAARPRARRGAPRRTAGGPAAPAPGRGPRGRARRPGRGRRPRRRLRVHRDHAVAAGRPAPRAGVGAPAAPRSRRGQALAAPWRPPQRAVPAQIVLLAGRPGSRPGRSPRRSFL